LSESIRSLLVKLHSKLNQDISEGRLRRHLEPCGKKLLKDDGLIVSWVWNNLFPWLVRETFGKISQCFQLPDTTHSDGQGPKIIAPRGFTWIYDSALLALDISDAG
jgi:hypothetical protein